eukprot:1229810-Prymnesium_polylepis.1
MLCTSQWHLPHVHEPIASSSTPSNGGNQRASAPRPAISAACRSTRGPMRCARRSVRGGTRSCLSAAPLGARASGVQVLATVRGIRELWAPVARLGARASRRRGARPTTGR